MALDRKRRLPINHGLKYYGWVIGIIKLINAIT